MTWNDFIFRLAIALLCGSAIGLERQWRQRMTGLCTNVLVSLGPATFVMIGALVPGTDSQGRIASSAVLAANLLLRPLARRINRVSIGNPGSQESAT